MSWSLGLLARQAVWLVLALCALLLAAPVYAEGIALVVGNDAHADKPLRNPVNDAELMQRTLQGYAKRIALVVGNAAYADKPLINPVNDAELMQHTLQGLGFEVSLLRNADRRTLLAGLRDFEAKARNADVALFYFAGHGTQVGGNNYLLPLRAQIRAESDVPEEALDAHWVLRSIENAQAKVGLVILDACHDNPYAGATRSSSRGLGLGRMSVPTGSIVAYATAPGRTAEDGSGRNGVYTEQLARHLNMPGLDLREVLDRTAQKVERLTGGKQRPHEEVGLLERVVLKPDVAMIYFAGHGTALPPPESTPAPTQPVTPLASPGVRGVAVANGSGTGAPALTVNQHRQVEAETRAQIPQHSPANSPIRPSQNQSSSSAISRFPTMEAPTRVAATASVAVQVWLTEEQITPEVKVKTGDRTAMTEDGQLAMQLTAGQEKWDISVVLSAPGFDIVSPSGMQSVIQLGRTGDSTPVLFNIRAKEGGSGQRMLRATLWHSGQYLASISRTIVIDANVDTNSAQSALPIKEAFTRSSADGLRRVTTSRPATIESPQQSADLTVYVRYDDPQKIGHGQIIVASPHLRGSILAEEFYTPPGAEAWLDAQYARLMRAARARGAQPVSSGKPSAPFSKEGMVAMTKGLGHEVYQRLAPTLFKKVLGSLVSDSKMDIRSIQVYSNNPVIPWELMRPRLENGQDLDFLGIEFRLARWHADGTQDQLDKPLRAQTLRELVVVAPDYKVVSLMLPNQAQEVNRLSRIPGFRKSGTTHREVLDLARHPPVGIVHFVGHGMVSGTSPNSREYLISLNDQDLDVMAWRGITEGQPRNATLFFFNACSIGQTESVVGSIDGWAPAVLSSGASGYIGGLWPLIDEAAAMFSERFYDRLQSDLQNGGAVVTDSLANARKLFYETGDPTHLAYVFYGDVNLRLEPPR